MKNRIINKADYTKYFDDFSKKIKNQRVEIEVLGLDIGNQIETESVLLEGLSYDSENETLFIHTPHLDHAVNHPNKIIAAEEGATITSFSIADRAGYTHLVKFRQPLAM